ncbi:MAG: CopG family transcriptional regulator [Acidobacteriota bacterium]
MHRTTLMLPPDLKIQAQRQASKEGISLGELIRRAIESHLKGSGITRRAADPLFADLEVFSGDVPTDASKNHDRYLYDDP